MGVGGGGGGARLKFLPLEIISAFMTVYILSNLLYVYMSSIS